MKGWFSVQFNSYKGVMIGELTMKIDPYKHKEKYLNWKPKVKDGIPGISEANSETILQYLSDMEHGLNVSAKSVKGPRSFIRLNNLRQRLAIR